MPVSKHRRKGKKRRSKQQKDTAHRARVEAAETARQCDLAEQLLDDFEELEEPRARIRWRMRAMLAVLIALPVGVMAAPDVAELVLGWFR